MNVRTLKDSVGAVFSPKVSADSVYLSGSETNLTTKLNNIDSHTGNSDIHITSSEKTSWNNKYDKEELKQEIADVMNYCILLSHQIGVDPKQIILDKMEISAKKYPVEKCKGVSTKYDKL